MNNIRKNIYLILVGLFLLSCKPIPIETPIATKTNQHLQFFGFSLVDVGWDDPSDSEVKSNYLDEVQSFTNIADIIAFQPEDNLKERIQAMNKVQVRPLIHISELFFEQKKEGGQKSGVIYGLRVDYQERWNTFVKINDLDSNQETIACLYIGEEPVWNSIPEEEFNLACTYIKETLPNIPLLSVEAYLAIDEMYIPQALDWVAFDHYFLSKPSTSSDFQRELNVLKSKLHPHQKIFLIMDSHWIDFFHGSAGIGIQDMDVIARDYYDMANLDTTIIGILGYHWPSGFDFKKTIGARNMPPNVIQEYKNIGNNITGK